MKKEILEKPVKIFSLPWHIAHQHELCKIPNIEWTYLKQHARKWGTQARPLPEKLNWALYYEPGKYDLAVLHVDQQCLTPEIAYGKAMVFREMKAQIKDIPIIVLNHGTPVYPEVFIQLAEKDGYKPTEQAGEQWARDKMKELLKGTTEMVVNSHEAQKMWGWGRTIVHGMDPDEWFDLPKEPRVVTFISPAGIGDKYYGRAFFREVVGDLKHNYGIDLIWISKNTNFTSWEDYRNFLGRSLVYFNPTIGSPMPRTRTEAMLSGCCVVTTPFHDADTFIKDGENGFLCKLNPADTARQIAELVFDYDKAIKIGQKGKETAKEIFSKERFQQDWIKLINEVLNR